MPSNITGTSNPVAQWCCNIAAHAWRCFELETFQWVKKEIKDSTDPTRLLLDGGYDDRLHSDRLAALRQLMGMDHPFQQKTIAILARAVRDSSSSSSSLPVSENTPDITYSAFCHNLAKQLILPNPSPVAPWRSKSQSWGVFVLTAAAILDALVIPTSDSKRGVEILGRIFVHTLKSAHISCVPWYHVPESSRSRRRPAPIPSISFWLPITQPLVSLDPSNLEHRLLTSPFNGEAIDKGKAERLNPSAVWNALTINFAHLADYFKKTIPPSEFKVDCSRNPTADTFVLEVYKWTEDNFNMHDPVHQMALFLAIIVSTLPPAIFFPLNAISSLPKIEDPDDNKGSDDEGAHMVIDEDDRRNGSRWVAAQGQPVNEDEQLAAEQAARARKASFVSERVRTLLQSVKLEDNTRKGHKDAAPYILMVTAYAIGLWDSRSPLYIHALNNLRNNKGLGSEWTKKHSKSFIFIGYSLLTPPLFSLS